jgi:LDH2 family malate/lactate/ureidoglycolate dehydrogenase
MWSPADGYRFDNIICALREGTHCSIVEQPNIRGTRDNMQLSISQAVDVAARALTHVGMAASAARIVADHLVDANLCGHEFSGMPRVLAIAEELRKKPKPPGAIRVVREDRCSALIDGGDNIAYVVSLAAVDKAVELCRSHGVAVVCAHNTWFSGRLTYYVERAARAGYVAMHTTNTTARVAPYGGIDRLFGTNPLAMGFPGEDDPFIIDIGTSATWGDVVLAATKGEDLPARQAVDPEGHPTVDPRAALDGAFLPWGGQRGSALSIAVQLLGMLAGSATVIEDVSNYGLFFLVMDPDVLSPQSGYQARVSELRRVISGSRPAPGVSHVRPPGDGSLQRRKQALAEGVVYVDDRVYERILALCE